MTELEEKAKRIKLLILDVDGILTDGSLYYTDTGDALRAFNVQDGLGIKLLQNAGITCAVISAKQSAAVKHRLRDLKVMYCYLGQQNKLPAYEDIKLALRLADDEIAYMGDDLTDLALLSRVGLAISVPNATPNMQRLVHMVTQKSGGQGAVRETCEFILAAQGQLATIYEKYSAATVC